MRVKLRYLPLVTAAALILPACGGDDDDTPNADEAADEVDDAVRENLPGGTLPGGVTIPDITMPDIDMPEITMPEDLDDLMPGGSLPEGLDDLMPGGSLPEGLDDLDDLPDIDMPEAGSGSCAVELTGLVEASWGEQQNTGSGIVSYWFDETEKSFMGDDLSIIANCVGEGSNSFSIISSNDADEENLPMAPATYELTESTLLGASGLWTLLLTVDGTDAVYTISEDGGTLEVTEFSDDTFTFVLDATVVDSLASMTGGSTDPAQLHVEFTLSDT